ncbi:MAG: ribonuclease R [Clostridia bacterium]|nr:ribonuclease R [Clostridia bacterium]
MLKFFEENASFPLMFSEAAGILGVPESDMDEFYKIMDELILEGHLIKTGKKRYSAAKNAGVFEADFTGNERGFGFASVDGREVDFYIAEENTNGAIDSDRVLIKKLKQSSGEREEAAVIKILKRKKREFTGVFKGNGIFGYVLPNDKKLPCEIYINKNTAQAQDGDRVVAVLCEKISSAECEITEVLGKNGDIGLDVLCILRNHGIKEEFPENVVRAAKRQPKEVSDEEMQKRVDLTNEIIVTIDGEDAKDLDDAVSIKRLENGNFELGMHIADVGNYVKRGTVIDKEAFRRGTSVYPVDRVVPMLPKELSNGICSLNPKVKRLTLSVLMEINQAGVVLSRKIFESVIKTTERMSYTDVTLILEGNEEVCAKYKDLVPKFFLYKELADILRKKRENRGAIDFDLPESKAVLDENGRCVDIIKCEKGISNGIIEEFMLVANETVAEFMTEKKMPFVYRVHEAPSKEKLAAISETASLFGYKISKNPDKVTPEDFSNLIKKCQGKKEERLLTTLALRSMMKAEYKSENLGHFGLASKCYCHFTSPIRRYPDLVIHRIIKDFLHNKKIDKDELSEFCDLSAEQASITEQKAQEAEREAVSVKKAEFMAAHIGEKFSGVVSSVTSFGMFVELSNSIEGLVTMTELSDDYYEFDEKQMCLFGIRKGKVYSLGDNVTVCAVRADKETGEIDFSLTGAEMSRTKKENVRKDKPYKRQKSNKTRKDKNNKSKIDTKRFLKKKSRRGKKKK